MIFLQPLAVLRFLRAVASLLSLLVRPRLLRDLPWAYAGRRIRSDGLTGFAAACLAISTGFLLVGVLVSAVLPLALLAAAVSLTVRRVVKDRS